MCVCSARDHNVDDDYDVRRRPRRDGGWLWQTQELTDSFISHCSFATPQLHVLPRMVLTTLTAAGDVFFLNTTAKMMSQHHHDGPALRGGCAEGDPLIDLVVCSAVQ